MSSRSTARPREGRGFFGVNISGVRDQEPWALSWACNEVKCDWSPSSHSSSGLPQNAPPSEFTADGIVTLSSGYIVSRVRLFIHLRFSVCSTHQPAWPPSTSGPQLSSCWSLYGFKPPTLWSIYFRIQMSKRTNWDQFSVVLGYLELCCS